LLFGDLAIVWHTAASVNFFRCLFEVYDLKGLAGYCIGIGRNGVPMAFFGMVAVRVTDESSLVFFFSHSSL
jgi:hypothetical protein